MKDKFIKDLINNGFVYDKAKDTYSKDSKYYVSIEYGFYTFSYAIYSNSGTRLAEAKNIDQLIFIYR